MARLSNRIPARPQNPAKHCYSIPRLVYPYLEEEMSLATPLPVGSAVPSRSGQPGRILPLAERSARGRDADKELRDEIQRIALEFNCYGRRRIRKELRRRDWKVNHKRVRRRNRHGHNDSHVFPCVTFSSRLATSRD